jgi:peptidoglycan/xylan/chitin deacetylase (PgdA/CDA1 family)
MTGRWNWEFEEEKRARPRSSSTSPPPPPPPAPGPDRGAQIRRRRIAAALGLAALIALVVAALAGSHHGRSAATAAAASARVARRQQHARPQEPAEDEQDDAVHAVLAYTPFVKKAGGQKREIALTFDDGPGPYTPEVLDVLEREHVHATFFEIGRMLQYFGASTTREIKDGDVIGDHTQTHPMMAQLSAHDQHEQLFEQIARVELLGGPRPVLFRPPYGSFNTTTIGQLHTLHLLMVLWSADTDDYLQPGVPVIVQRALEGAQPGAIILMHDAGGTRTQTIAALPTIIRMLRARGYRLVTVPQLMKDDPPAPGQPLPSSLAGD